MKAKEKVKHLQFLLYMQRQITYAVQAHMDDTTEWLEKVVDDYCKMNKLDDSLTNLEGELK